MTQRKKECFILPLSKFSVLCQFLFNFASGLLLAFCAHGFISGCAMLLARVSLCAKCPLSQYLSKSERINLQIITKCYRLTLAAT